MDSSPKSITTVSSPNMSENGNIYVEIPSPSFDPEPGTLTDAGQRQERVVIRVSTDDEHTDKSVSASKLKQAHDLFERVQLKLASGSTNAFESQRAGKRHAEGTEDNTGSNDFASSSGQPPTKRPRNEPARSKRTARKAGQPGL